MSSYCLKCRKNIERKYPKIVKTKKERVKLLSKCAVCNSKKLKFTKEQQVRIIKSFSRNKSTNSK